MDPLGTPAGEPAKGWPALASAPTSLERSCRAIRTWPITCLAKPWTGTREGSSRRSRTRPSGGRMRPSPRVRRRSGQRAGGPGSERSASGSTASSGSRRDADQSEGGSMARAHRHPVNQALIDRSPLGANRRQGHRVHGQLTVHRHPDRDRFGLAQRQRRPSLPFRSLSVSSCGGLPARRGGTLPMGRSRTHRWPTAP